MKIFVNMIFLLFCLKYTSYTSKDAKIECRYFQVVTRIVMRNCNNVQIIVINLLGI